MYRTVHRVFVINKIAVGNVVLEDQESVHHLANVLRVSIGTELRVFNEVDGEWLAKIVAISKKKSIELNVTSQIRVPEPRSKVSLAFALIKPDRMRFVIEKATEIGADELIPIITQRCIIRSINKQKLDSYVVGAVEQSERLTIPIIKEASSLEIFLKIYKESSIIFCNEYEESKSIREISSSNEKRVIVIGPEGGFTDKERTLVLSYPNVKSVYLTKNILRAETAAIFALSNLI